MFTGKALWVLSTSAFLLGVPWALAYAEEEQYIQMEREQGMIRGANEVCGFPYSCFLSHLRSLLLSLFYGLGVYLRMSRKRLEHEMLTSFLPF
jgi:hypothetical protein